MNNIIAYEVDMQNDFMNPDGRLYVPGAQEIKPAIARVVKFLLRHNGPRIRSRDRQFQDDPELMRNGGPFPDHCMDWGYRQQNSDGTYGIDFIPELRDGTAIAVEHKVAEGRIKQYSPAEIKQFAEYFKEGYDLAIEKQHYDVFTNPAAEQLLKELNVKKAIVYGVATDYCVKAAVLGMQKRGIQTYVLQDAISGITPEGAAKALDEMRSAGAKMIACKDLESLIRRSA